MKEKLIIIKEEGSKEEDRQVEADVKKKYLFLRITTSSGIRKIFKWADRGKH